MELFPALETDARCKGLERLMEAVSPNAFYNSDNRPDPPKCHPNTRVAVIDKIVDWGTGRIDTNAFIMWLYGPAGAGKTAIARKVAELFAEHGLLLSSFLFFRSDPTRNTMMPLVANFAYCVAQSAIPNTQELIESVIEADPLILSYSIEVQLTKLVFEPLRHFADQGYFLNGQLPQLVVIDGLDECLDKSAQTNLIQFLSSSVARYQLALKFLIVSRPEAHIKSAVALAAEQTTLSHLELNNDFQPDEDIRRFLTDKFREIKMCHPFRSGIPSFWPSTEEMDSLIRKASGQFIYASLAVRFINSTCNSPMRQLDIVLELRPPINHDLPFAELDTLYRFILSGTKNLDLVLRILGVIDAFGYDFEGLVVIESVLGLEGGDARIYFGALNSLLEVQTADDDEGYVVFHHSSFMDFLCTPERSMEYCIDTPKCKSLIAQWILQVFSSDGMYPRSSDQFAGIQVVLNKTFTGHSTWRYDIHDWLVNYMNLVSYLQDSLWTLELEHDLARFSISKYLNWLDQRIANDPGDADTLIDWNGDFPEKFLHYLESKVCNPCSQTMCLLKLLMLIRVNLTFITIIPCVTRNMLCLRSIIPPGERKCGC